MQGEYFLHSFNLWILLHSKELIKHLKSFILFLGTIKSILLCLLHFVLYFLPVCDESILFEFSLDLQLSQDLCSLARLLLRDCGVNEMLEFSIGVDDSDMAFDHKVESVRIISIIKYSFIFIGLDKLHFLSKLGEVLVYTLIPYIIKHR